MWVLFECKKLKLLNKQHFVENKTDYAACLQNSVYISLFPKYTKLISEVFLHVFAYENVGHLKVIVHTIYIFCPILSWDPSKMDHGHFLHPVFSCLQYVSPFSSLKYLLHFFMYFVLVRWSVFMEWSLLPVPMPVLSSSFLVKYASLLNQKCHMLQEHPRSDSGVYFR